MNKVAISFSTKDRVELSRRTIEPLLQPDKFDLFVNDGSTTAEGQDFPKAFTCQQGVYEVHFNVRGGADAAIVYALTTMLSHPNNYSHVGLVENDVLLHPDWFGPTMALFQRGADEGIPVGAVSPRAYADRVLIQRDGYAVMHNLGAGVVIFTRQAAEIVLNNFRTPFTLENRQTFMQLASVDISKWWTFKQGEHWLCADWGFDATLARHGLASLALTPSPVEMIGQEPPLADQGLTLVAEPVELLRDEGAFYRYAVGLSSISAGCAEALGWGRCPRMPDGSQIIFAHQVGLFAGGHISEGWKLRWAQGFGPFAFEATTVSATVLVTLSGPVNVIVGCPECFEVTDTDSGYSIAPSSPADPSQQVVLGVPGGITHRLITITARKPGGVFYGLQVIQPQVWRSDASFDHTHLPPTE